MDQLTSDWREFLSLLTSHRVRFVIVGGHATAVHAEPRVTGDLGVFVECSEKNATKLRRVLRDFGIGDEGPSVRELATPGKVFMIGRPPHRIDILTKLFGVRFENAWKTRVRVEGPDGVLPFIGRRALIRNKRASGRPKDLVDLVMLGVDPRGGSLR